MRHDQLEIITNNPSINNHWNGILFNHQSSLFQVLTVVRDRIHLGAKIISHPLAGSVKPHETPYRSIIIYNPALNTPNPCGELDYSSLNTIEQAIERYQLLCKHQPNHLQDTHTQVEARFNDKQRTDFQLIDFQLIKSCLSSLGLGKG